LKSQDVYALIGERAADFSERSRTIVHAHGQFFGDGHAGDLLKSHEWQAL
jgi:hypothetical protein